MESAAPGAAAAAPQTVQDMCKFTDRPHHNIAYKRCPFYHVPEHCNHYRIASLHPPAYPVTATASRFPINRNSIWRRMRTEALRSVWVKRAPWMKRLCRTATYYLHTTSEKNQEASSKFVETKSWPSLKPETPLTLPTCHGAQWPTNWQRTALLHFVLVTEHDNWCSGLEHQQLVGSVAHISVHADTCTPHNYASYIDLNHPICFSYKSLSPGRRQHKNILTPHILWSPNVHYRIHKCPPSVPILSQNDQLHTRTSHFLKMHLNIIFPIYAWVSQVFPSGFPTKTLYTPLLSPHTCYIPRPSHSSRFDPPHNIWWAVEIILSSLLCSFLHSPVTSSILENTSSLHLSFPPRVLHTPPISFFSIWSPAQYLVSSTDHFKLLIM